MLNEEGNCGGEAPLIAVGQHYTGQLNNHKADTNFGGYREIAIWHLPPLTTRDVVTVDWHSLPLAGNPGRFPICMVFAQGIDDFNWGSVFERTVDQTCDYGPGYGVSASGSARTEITTQETNSTSSYLEFYSSASETNPSKFETFPYDFSVEPPLHYLGLSIQPVKRVSASGVLRATATLATGLPAPDGLSFSLAVTWPGGGTASATGTSVGGTIGFQLALPETAFGKEATFVASHPVDGGSTSASPIMLARPTARLAERCAGAQTASSGSCTQRATKPNRPVAHRSPPAAKGWSLVGLFTPGSTRRCGPRGNGQ